MREHLIPSVDAAAGWALITCPACGRNARSNPETNELRPHRPGRAGGNTKKREDLRGLMCDGKTTTSAPQRPRQEN